MLKLIVDSGSIDNLVSMEMVEKLNLRNTVHPEPYRVAWLQKGHQVLVKEQCQVKFQIGSYQDEVRCDIIEMDAYHILSGRPWKFDKEAVHEGKRNVYSFEMNGKKHSLHPLKGKQEEANNQLLIMTDKKIVNDWKAEENDNEVELSNMVCSGWLKGKIDQQEMSNASMALIEEA